ncbi:MAG: class I SAM-dependent RNA methyltransferase, partial [Leptolyngbyaceae bacterium]|nr:class I SAM-dependent RNA methyltransferase [Leptolyngbyaceae bacterium]
MQYFATVARGLEEVAADELRQLGASEVESSFTGVSFTGDRPLLYRVNLWARIPFRILMQIHTCSARSPQQLYSGIQAFDWSKYLTPSQTFSVRATGKNEQLNHSHYTALQVKNAIVDQQRQQFNERSDIDTEQPDLTITVHIQGNQCVVSLDSSGGSLHRRGYRPAVGLAPLKETLAAALIDLTNWTPELAFYDPLCGSGTLPIEASLKALNMAPGLFREQFAFEHWSDFDAPLWEQMLSDAETQQRQELLAPIVGGDRHLDAIENARSNAYQCGVGDRPQLLQQDIQDAYPPAEHGVLICNPPYGERIGNAQDLGDFYKLMGDV